MKLYDGGKVPNARRVRIFLAEKGINIPLETLDLGKNEHKTTAFTALNPLQRVPMLQFDDGSVLTESIAICRYFEALHPTPPLFGSDARSIGAVEMWQRQLELNLFLPIAYAFRHLHPAMAPFEVPQNAAWGETNRERAVGYMSLLDRHLEGQAFVATDSFTVADITGLVALDFARAAKIAVPENLRNLARWHAALAARPSARA